MKITLYRCITVLDIVQAMHMQTSILQFSELFYICLTSSASLYNKYRHVQTST